MNNSTIKHKLRVFISSKCGGKYTIARKALKELLFSTGLVEEPYVYECESASSEDNISSYLQFVDDANLCIFLIDNEDGVSNPVLSEERRAKEKGLRLIYIFCDETSKEPTIMQNEIKNKNTQKYEVVHEFSDIVKAAYDSTLQDIIAIYKKKPLTDILHETNGFQDQMNNGIIETSSKSQNKTDVVELRTSHTTGQYSLFSKIHLESIPKTEKCLLKLVSLGQLYEEKESNDFDEELSCFLMTSFYKEAFDEEKFQHLTDNIIKIQPKSLTQLLSLRFSAIKQYYIGDFQEALQQLKLAMVESVENEEVPNWISLDIAIDIRNVIVTISELNNEIPLENEGQNFINENPELLYYPEIDRLIRDSKSNLLKYYLDFHYSSPYSIGNGDIDSLFTPVAKAFCVAISNGSLIHTAMSKHNVADILFTLSSIYDDHDFIVELIRESIINRDKNKLNKIERVYDIKLEMISSTDVNEIMKDLNNIAPFTHQIMSKYLALTYLGYYCDNDSYELYSIELLKYAKEWIQDSKRICNLWIYIYNFLKENIFRMEHNEVIELILSIFTSGLKRWYNDCMKLLDSIDINKIPPEKQQRIIDIFITIIEDKDSLSVIPNIKNAMISFARKTTIDSSKLKDAIERYMPDYFKNVFSLELLPNESSDHNKYIERYIELATLENKTQGVDSIYKNYTSSPLNTIKNIISLTNAYVSDAIAEKIIRVSLDTLERPTQTISAKLSAVENLMLLCNLYPNNFNLVDLQKILVEKFTIFANGREDGFFNKSSNNNLNFAYQLLLMVLGQGGEDNILEYLLTLDRDNKYDIIDALRSIYNLLANSDINSFSESFLYGCTNYAIVMTSDTEIDVKFYAVKCLIEMTKYERLQKIILQRLSKIMDSGSYKIKIAIVSRIGKIQSVNKEYIDYILKKALVDNNFLVRLSAQKNSR